MLVESSNPALRERALERVPSSGVIHRLPPDSRFLTASNGIGPGNGVQTKFGIGYDYFLSKRTNVFADVGTARKAGTVGNVPGGASFINNAAYAVGLKHTF
jgi:predicted porin